ncbi:Cytochrome P450 67, partial [Termitomyces sp. T112]
MSFVALPSMQVSTSAQPYILHEYNRMQQYAGCNIYHSFFALFSSSFRLQLINQVTPGNHHLNIVGFMRFAGFTNRIIPVPMGPQNQTLGDQTRFQWSQQRFQFWSSDVEYPSYLKLKPLHHCLYLHREADDLPNRIYKSDASIKFALAVLSMTWQSVGTILLPPLLGGSAAHIVYRWWEPRQLYLHFSLLVVAPLTLTPYLTAYFSHALLAALSAWVCYLASLVACTVLYRVSPVHPLAKYPGPLPCKITKLYFAIVAFGGKQHKWYNELHRRYGDVVRIGPNELSFCSPDLIAPGLGSHGMPKSAAFDRHSIDPDCKIMVAIRNPPQHAKVRRVWARGFTPEALRAYHPI